MANPNQYIEEQLKQDAEGNAEHPAPQEAAENQPIAGQEGYPDLSPWGKDRAEYWAQYHAALEARLAAPYDPSMVSNPDEDSENGDENQADNVDGYASDGYLPNNANYSDGEDDSDAENSDSGENHNRIRNR